MLCDHVPSSMLATPSPFGGGFNCKEQAPSVKTDENGVYVFNNLEPSHLAESTNSNAANSNSTKPINLNRNTGSTNTSPSDDLRSYIPVAVVEGQTPLYFYWESGLGSSSISTADTIYPDPNRTYEVKTINIRKNDLKLTSPVNGEKITDRRPALNWVEYPDTHIYFVHLDGDSDANRNMKFDLDSSTPGAKPKDDLPNGKYRWSVRADDEHFTEMAESIPDTGTFEVVDQLTPAPKKGK